MSDTKHHRKHTRGWPKRLGPALGLGALALGGVVGGGLLVRSGVAEAQDPAAAGDASALPTARPELADLTSDEVEVLRLFTEGKLITARRKVEPLLEDNPDSFVAQYVFGNILRTAEGSLPEAMKHLGKARELYESKYETWPPPEGGSSEHQLHRELLYAIQALAGELEQHEYRLEMLDYYDALYSPNLTAEHAWPLMQLGRFDEAREYAEKAKGKRDPYQRSLGLNAMCAIEGEAGTRLQRYDACRAALDDALGRAQFDKPGANPEERTAVTVHAYNAALASFSVMRPDEVERLAAEGTRRNDFTMANPWRLLVRLYVAQGRMMEAVEAVREMQAWRARQPPYLRDMDRAETDGTYAMAMLVAGETEAGLRAADRALRRPDRRGLTSSTREQALGAHALLRRALQRTHAELLSERASYSRTMGRAKRIWGAVGARVDAWSDEERLVSVLSDDDRLYATFQMYVAGGLDPVEPWMLGDLVDVLGPGVVYVTLEEVREREQDREDGLYESLEPYYDAIEAEVHLSWRDYDKAREMAEDCLSRLPATEVLLRARVAAVAARAARKQGDEEAELDFLVAALDADAGIIRRMGLTLPAEVHNGGSGDAADLAERLLLRSPRLRGGSEAFTVAIEGEGASLSVCLLAKGNTISCASPELPPPPDDGSEPELPSDDELGRLAVAAFHDRAFATPVGASNIDLRSLDGTSTVQSDMAREKMKKSLESLVEEK